MYGNRRFRPKITKKIRISPEKYGYLLKFDFRSFLAYLVSFFIIFQLDLNSSITEKSENSKNGSYLFIENHHPIKNFTKNQNFQSKFIKISFFFK